ncbi:MAG: hypothetical protein LBS62_00995 [Clostridiales bacterium]|jgi:hypothetical protein|nr:hypothetical protein [Clostridiales bacterium]
MSYVIKDGTIHAAEGVPQTPRWLADGRLAFSWDGTSVDVVEYYGPREYDSNAIIFRKNVFECFRVYLEKDGRLFSPDFRNVEMWPYSIEADWEAEGHAFRFGLYALEESIVFAITPADSAHFRARLQFYTCTQLTPAETGDFFLETKSVNRVWQDWTETDNALEGGFHENAAGGDVCLRIGSNRPAAITKGEVQTRFALTADTLAANETRVFAITPDTDKTRCGSRNIGLLNNFKSRLEAQRARYKAVQLKSPKLYCEQKGLMDFFALAPLYHESLKAVDTLGAVRAKTNRYWIWGWDELISNQACLYWGDADFIKDMLNFVESSTGPEGSIAHAYTTANTPASFMPDAADSMFLYLLHHYASLTGDTPLIKQYYPFAKTILRRVLSSQLEGVPLLRGTSLFPDFPFRLQETGSDISLFNNSLAYGALRAMESLAALADDCETAELARTFSRQMRESFTDVFFEPELGMFVNSADADTRVRRRTVNIGGLMWENDFVRELVNEKDTECMAFVEKHGIGKSYFRAIPLWDASYDGDGNQLHCTWPVVDEYALRLANRMGRADILQTWAGWVQYWTGKLLCPEGISYQVETDAPELDRWNCASGTWQGYSMRKWYQDILHSCLGVLPDSGGITFAPSGFPFRLLGLHYRGTLVDINCAGTGRYVRKLTVNGAALTGVYKVPFAMLDGKPRVEISVTLAAEPAPLEFRGCYTARVVEAALEDSRMTVTLAGEGDGTAFFHVEGPCEILLNGKPADVCYYNEEEPQVLVPMRRGERHILEVRR